MNSLKRTRLDFGLTQTAVARRLGISRRHYQRFENEGFEISAERRRLLAKIFNCSVAKISQKEE
jgi:transcriptional regulator with XRE-family HTH domain